MCELDAMLSIVITQMMQNAESYHNVRISKSRVVAKRRRVADYESSFASMRSFGGSDTSRINVESEVIDVWKPRQYLCRAAPNIDDLIARFCSDMALNEPPTQRVSSNGVLEQIVQKRNFKPTL
jgi:hypothetical protein